LGALTGSGHDPLRQLQDLARALGQGPGNRFLVQGLQGPGLYPGDVVGIIRLGGLGLRWLQSLPEDRPVFQVLAILAQTQVVEDLVAVRSRPFSQDRRQEGNPR